MGLNFRKSVGLGPFKVNLSKSGIGYSVGGKGFRTGVSSKGRKYSTFSLPGTGISYTTSSKDKLLGGVLDKVQTGVQTATKSGAGKKGCAVVMLVGILVFTLGGVTLLRTLC